MRLDPVSLKLFVTILETGTIVGAAQQEHIAASAVSRRISDLESVLKVTLLQRTNKGIEPTAAGLALLNLARGILHNLDDVEVQMREFSAGLRGNVRLAANLSSITQFLPDEIKSFLAIHPQVQIHLEEMISTRVTRAVAENRADIGLYTKVPLGGNEVEVYPFRIDRLAVVVPNGHSLAECTHVRFSDALDYDFVGLHTGSAINLELIRAATEIERTVRMRIQVTSYEALCLMVETGLGIGILPDTVARRYVDILDLTLIPLEETWAAREILLCVRSRTALPIAARKLFEHLCPET